MLSVSNFEERKGYSIRSEQEREEGKAYAERPIEEIRNLLDYAKNAYNCEISDEFVEKMYKLAYLSWIPTKRHIDAVYAEWKLWTSYVAQESFNDFMLHEIERLFTIHTTSTFFSKNLGSSYIGQKAKVIKEPPFPMVTTISKSCKLTLDLKEVAF